MFRSYIKSAFRNIARKKVHSFINIAGLAAGMAVAILIGMYILDAFSFNQYHQNRERIGRLMSSTTFNGESETYASAAAPLAAELHNKYGNDFKRIALSS